MPRLQAEPLLAFVTDIVAAIGSSSDAARTVAEHLVTANLAGHDSHGVIRLKQYAEHARAGKVDPTARPVALRERGATALVDGNLAWGQVTAMFAMDLAVAKAKAHGSGAVCVRNCYHVGRVGVYPLRAAREGFIAIVFANTYGVARVAPWGGTEPRLATNPIAAAVPTRGEPFLLDITTSVVAEGKVRLAKNEGRPIPEGWVLDREGRPSTDPAALYDGGTLLPLGGREGHKGYGLSALCDILGGVVTGAGSGLMTKSHGNGLFIQVTDPGAFAEREELLARIDQFIAYLKSSARKPGVAEILLPGEPEQRTEARRRREGVDIDARTWEEVAALARELGLDAP
jgi:uncharacterized oxidoreductase